MSAENGPAPTNDRSPENSNLELEREKKFPFDGVIVFGHGWSEKGWKLSWEAKARALAAYELWKQGVAPKIILTGGKPSPQDLEKYGPDILANCQQMKEFLVTRFQIPEEAIVLEDEPGSIKTVDNVGLAINALNEQQLASENFVTVSTGFHLDRISKIMEKYGLKSQPVSAEQGLAGIARDHAEKMKQIDVSNGLTTDLVEKNYLHRLGLYDRYLERIKLKDTQIYQKELKDEPKWQEAMNNWGYYGPLLLAVRGEKLKEIVGKDKDQILAWLDRHPDIEVTIEDLIEGNFNYRELVEKGREMPQ